MQNSTDRKMDNVAADVKDAGSELKNRVQAGAEKANRAVQGDSMPLGERVASHVKEAGHDLKADFDHSKRDVRNEEA